MRFSHKRGIFPSRYESCRVAFTLIELLIVIAIVAVLALVVLLVINPAELLKQGRDSNRLSDMATIRGAIQTYQADIPAASLGSSTITYLSLIDLTATTTAGTDCTALGLPGGTYHCASSSTARNIDGTGWLPFNFSSLSSRSPLSVLPIDPTNSTSSNLYYAYVTDGTSWKVSSFPESQKYQAQTATGASSFQSGTNLFLTSPLPGLVGWWKFDEGAGTTATDSSGYGNTGNWSGTQTGTSGYYSAGKVGGFAGTFDGTSTYIVAPPISAGTNVSVSLWFNRKGATLQFTPLAEQGGVRRFRFTRYINALCFGSDSVTDSIYCTANIFSSTDFWYHVAAVFDGSHRIFVNGTEYALTKVLGLYASWNVNQLNIGYRPYTGIVGPFNGFIDDVRIYNRALSPVEIQRISLGTE